MEQKPHEEGPISLEDHILEVYSAVKSIESQQGSVAALISTVEEAYSFKDEVGTFRHNVLQLRRMSKALVLPNGYSDNDDAMMNGFYWGSLLGMMVGHYSMQEKWSTHLYNSLNRQYMECYVGCARSEEGFVQYEPPTPDPEFLLNVAELYFDRIDKAEESLPGTYWNMIVTWASELSISDEQEYYIKTGFVNVVSLALEAYEYNYNGRMFDEITKNINSRTKR